MIPTFTESFDIKLSMNLPSDLLAVPSAAPVPAEATDRIDRVIASWASARPDLDVSPIAVIARMQVVRGHIDRSLADVFARHGLTEPEFAMLATLVRLGGSASQHQLVDEMGLSAGTVSVRVDALVAGGMARRKPDAEDGRCVVISVTPRGRRRFDACAPEHLAGERRLISALSENERAALAGLLRKLTLSFEKAGDE
jgi:DNA-binding MarR family transcriptional regulator